MQYLWTGVHTAIVALLQAALRIEHKLDLILRSLQLANIASPNPRPLRAMDACTACFSPITYAIVNGITTRSCACTTEVLHYLPPVLPETVPARRPTAADTGGSDAPDDPDTPQVLPDPTHRSEAMRRSRT